ncbi:Threonine/homoserine efflux transporter RhtA [Lentibacillus halodurans]|uniref:Threonine/homoserine efflux transporter RhtA n=1 Tax=Lentibacillus halodurans TaxID=237679 RepID=A0A1I1A4Y0_9BACI|nr:DMT family transporter [Lentibacillus halodurans]SFB32416.1 Threonine/homoserine efflux transporter RhtA [Lentibacillus halodurans]
MGNSLLKNRWIVWTLILLITIIWGYAWVFMKASLNFMGPFTFSAFRFGTGAAVLLLAVWLLKKAKPARNMWKHLIIVGILQTTIVFTFVMYGMQFVDAGKSSVLLYSMPLWSSIFAVKILGEEITGGKFLGLVVGMLGLVTILGWDIFFVQDPATIFGELLIIVAAVSWAGANVYYRLKLEGMTQLQVSAYQMFFGTIGIVIATLFAEWGDPIRLTGESVFYILFTGVLASALCFTVWFVLLSIIDMVTATLSTLLVPVFGLFFGWWILGEELTNGILIGSAMIIAGIAVAQVFGKRKVEQTAET